MLEVVEDAARVDAVVEAVPIRPRFRAVGRGASDLNWGWVDDDDEEGSSTCVGRRGGWRCQNTNFAQGFWRLCDMSVCWLAVSIGR